MSDHFDHTKGYAFYASAAEAFRQVGLETAVKTYCSVQTWGTPQMSQPIASPMASNRTIAGTRNRQASHWAVMPSPNTPAK